MIEFALYNTVVLSSLNPLNADFSLTGGDEVLSFSIDIWGGLSFMKKDTRFLLFDVCKGLLIYLLFIMILYLITGSRDILHANKLLAVAGLWVISSKLMVSARDFFKSVTILSLTLGSIIFICYQENDNLLRSDLVTLLTSITSLSCFILLLIAIIKHKLVRQTVAALLLIPCFLLVILFWGYYSTSSAWFSSDTLLALMQTNISESSEFLKDYISVKTAIVLVVAALIFIHIYKLERKLGFINNTRIVNLTLIICLLGSGSLIYKTRHNLVTDIAFNAKKNLQKYADFTKMCEQRKQKISLKVPLSDVNIEKGVYVLVIGESQNREHMSAYGYNKQTTPWVESMREEDKFLFFNKVYSCHTHTVPVLTYALTAKNQYNNLSLGNAVSILEAAEASGFETVWLSNQVKYSAWDTPITVIANEANQQDWINRNLGETTATNSFDVKLVDSLSKIKIKDKMLIVIHLMGNHGSYDQRYPKQFAKFGSQDTISKYDNSILYNDYVMEQLFKKVKQLPNFQAMLYFADHADAVDQGLAHDASNFVWPMTHVPMYAYFSDSYMKEDKEVVLALRNKQDVVFTNDLIFNLMMSIMKLNALISYEKENDFVSPAYNGDLKRLKTLYGKKKLAEEN